MKVEMFLNFNGNCREAVEFYAKVFKSEVKNLMTYADMPPCPDYTPEEADKNKVMYAHIQFENMAMMFMDYTSCMKFTLGNNIHPTISSPNKDEITRLFNELKEDGTVDCELMKTFYSDLYGCVKDKFGVTWHILHMH
jgi:PhnB protein